MSQSDKFRAGGNLLADLLNGAAGGTPQPVLSGAALAPYSAVFCDKDLVETCFCLFENDLNVSRTAGKLYMHRNTLIYRISKLKRMTGLDVCKFGDAVTFIILYRFYIEEERNNGTKKRN